MSKSSAKKLDKLFDPLIKAARKALLDSGDDKWMWWIADEYLADWQRLRRALLKTYARDTLNNSLVFREFVFLHKEIRWLQVLFITGQYPLLGRNLRFIWEAMLRAYCVDTYADLDGPGPSLKEKAAWLKRKEKDIKTKAMRRATLPTQIQGSQREALIRRLDTLWDDLCGYAHPSGKLREWARVDARLFLHDKFDGDWAADVVVDANGVFDSLWWTVQARFSDAQTHLTDWKPLGLRYYDLLGIDPSESLSDNELEVLIAGLPDDPENGRRTQ